MTRSRRLLRAPAILLLPLTLLVSACGERVVTLGAFPPAEDVKALTEPKPVPTDAIATDPVAEAQYNAEVEGWGDRLYRAGGRVCRHAVANGMKLPFDCPKAEPQ
jgi:hypothetical protein